MLEVTPAPGFAMVTLEKDAQTKSGLFVAGTQDGLKRGRVEGLGPEFVTDHGVSIAFPADVGDVVLFDKGTEFSIPGQGSYYFVWRNNTVGRIVESGE
jgi:co-chaperonin GroES (HSP10)